MLESLAKEGIAPVSRELRSILALAILFLAAEPAFLCLSVVVQGPPLPPVRVKQNARIKVVFDGRVLVGKVVGVASGYTAPDIATLTSDTTAMSRFRI